MGAVRASQAVLLTGRRRVNPDPILRDDFGRTTGSNSVGSPSWGFGPGVTGPIYQTGTWSTNGNQLVSGNGAAYQIAWELARTTYSFRVRFGEPMTGEDAGVCVRAVDGGHTLQLVVYDGMASLRKYDPAQTILADLGTPGWDSGDWCRMDVTPTTVAVFKALSASPDSWAQVGTTVSNSDYSTATKAGLRANFENLLIDEVIAYG